MSNQSSARATAGTFKTPQGAYVRRLHQTNFATWHSDIENALYLAEVHRALNDGDLALPVLQNNPTPAQQRTHREALAAHPERENVRKAWTILTELLSDGVHPLIKQYTQHKNVDGVWRFLLATF